MLGRCKCLISHFILTHHHSYFLDLPCEAEACCDKFAFMAIHISICLVIVSKNWDINGKRVPMFLSLVFLRYITVHTVGMHRVEGMRWPHSVYMCQTVLKDPINNCNISLLAGVA